MVKKIISGFLNSKLYPYIVGAFIFIFWLLSFLAVNGKINPLICNRCEWIEMIIIALSFLLIGVFSKDIDPMVPIVMYTPFIYAHPFYVISMPYSLFIGIGALIVSLIIHQIIYKPKFKMGKNFIGIMALGV